MTTDEPPEEITYTLAEADLLLWDLESARDALDDLGALAALAGVEHQVIVLHRKWDSTKEACGEHRRASPSAGRPDHR
jgi:hypothetical protein